MFVAYGPGDDPELVVVCIVEQGGFGSVAAGPIVYKAFEEFFQEKAVNSLLYSIAVSYGESNPMEKSFELIRELTQQKSAVIIGRCSGAIYANDPEATTVFLHADKDCRIKRVMERDGINEKKAAKLIKEVDEKRASFHKFCTGKEWEDASLYQLSIDTGKLDISDAANMIINYINAKNIGQKHL